MLSIILVIQLAQTIFSVGHRVISQVRIEMQKSIKLNANQLYETYMVDHGGPVYWYSLTTDFLGAHPGFYGFYDSLAYRLGSVGGAVRDTGTNAPVETVVELYSEVNGVRN